MSERDATISPPAPTDQRGRPLHSLRISVTDRCNLRCTYCMPEEPVWFERDSILHYEEILRLVRIGAGGETVDLQPCGGTHVRTTAEIGRVRLGKVEKKGKRNRRVYMHLDGDAGGR